MYINKILFFHSKAEELLPFWMSHPDYIDPDLSQTLNIADLDYLHDTVKNNMSSMGYNALFPGIYFNY